MIEKPTTMKKPNKKKSSSMKKKQSKDIAKKYKYRKTYLTNIENLEFEKNIKNFYF